MCSAPLGWMPEKTRALVPPLGAVAGAGAVAVTICAFLLAWDTCASLPSKCVRAVVRVGRGGFQTRPGRGGNHLAESPRGPGEATRWHASGVICLTTGRGSN